MNPRLLYECDAHLSPCRTYRYLLNRRTGISGELGVLFVMLNPSTADEKVDDPTIRRCLGYARAWGYAYLRVANLFAFRATFPKDLLKAEDPVGPDNDEVLQFVAAHSRTTVCAWGNHGWREGRDLIVKEMLRRRGVTLYHLGLTKQDRPKHPLYLAKNLKPTIWSSDFEAAVDPFNPDWTSPPGDTILDILETKGISVFDFIERTELDSELVLGLIHGTVPLTEELAVVLHQLLGASVAFWIRREAHYREGLALGRVNVGRLSNPS